jgi:hypothetical protein
MTTVLARRLPKEGALLVFLAILSLLNCRTAHLGTRFLRYDGEAEYTPTTLGRTTAEPVVKTDIDVGIRSSKPREFFQQIQQEIDNEDWKERCSRFGEFIGPSYGEDKEPKTGASFMVV